MSGRTPRWGQIIVAVLMIGAAGLAWHQRDIVAPTLGFAAAEPPERKRESGPGVPVIVVNASEAADNIAIEVVGTGRARKSIMLRAESAGKVAEMPLETGRRFKSGDLLLRLGDTDARLAVELAKARSADAQRTLKRFQRLKSSGNAATARLDEARTAAEIARLELARARKTLADRAVRAPFDGVAGLSDIEVGAWVDTNIEIATFDDRGQILIAFDLPEALLARISEGLAVSATTPGVPGARIQGAIVAIDSRVNAQSRSVRVRVALPNADDQLRPGASFAVKLDLPGKTYVRAPELAVQFARQSLHVWRIKDGKAERVTVRLVRRLDGAVLLEGDLAPGDKVVVEGAQRLRPGRAVRILEQTPIASTGAGA